ncbi:keratin, type I cytoskeletal 17-like, partial [Hypanus sabinus]|uniref:keratin, type I cytoskeletal 17-like n=1 Tax=Hypanus sabinus TaxID=79690 RepID=UPI0028C4D98A
AEISAQPAAGHRDGGRGLRPGTDLTKVLDEMREKYELMAAKNQKEAEAWFQGAGRREGEGGGRSPLFEGKVQCERVRRGQESNPGRYPRALRDGSTNRAAKSDHSGIRPLDPSRLLRLSNAAFPSTRPVVAIPRPYSVNGREVFIVMPALSVSPQSSTVQQSVATSSQRLGTEKDQLSENRRKLQTVEIDLQTLLSVKSSLEDTLQNTEYRYSEQLYHLEDLLEQREAELAEIQADTRRQCDEYAQLLDIKTRLEMEIATYRRLLEGEDFSYSTEIRTVETIKEPEVITKKKVVTITETLVDGQVVESRQEVKEATT